MATPQASHSHSTNISQTDRHVRLRPAPGALQADDGRQGLDRALQISARLQTTLEVDKLISICAQEIKSSVSYHSVSYHHPEHGHSITLGEIARHTCNYRLVVNGQYLGEITFTRKRKFSQDESQMLEGLLCGLVYPLRNALLYTQALKAAFCDPLTGINNRSTMSTTLKREVELARRHDIPLSVIMLDIDRFKTVNDNYGHAAGDRAICAVADELAACVRSSDILFRYGGEEFAIILNNTGPDGAVLLAERIRQSLERVECSHNNSVIRITASMGVAFLEDTDDDEGLFKKADDALYQAKLEGRNRVRLAAA
jgi:diguanylate cyclase (GGDEF)-like protein